VRFRALIPHHTMVFQSFYHGNKQEYLFWSEVLFTLFTVDDFTPKPFNILGLFGCAQSDALIQQLSCHFRKITTKFNFRENTTVSSSNLWCS
jgi:hypothetical protein